MVIRFGLKYLQDLHQIGKQGVRQYREQAVAGHMNKLGQALKALAQQDKELKQNPPKTITPEVAQLFETITGKKTK